MLDSMIAATTPTGPLRSTPPALRVGPRDVGVDCQDTGVGLTGK